MCGYILRSRSVTLYLGVTVTLTSGLSSKKVFELLWPCSLTYQLVGTVTLTSKLFSRICCVDASWGCGVARTIFRSQWPWPLTYHFWVTLILTYDLVSRIIVTWPRGYKAWVHSQTQNKAQWLAVCGHVSASSQSLRFILSLSLYSSFITSRPEHIFYIIWGRIPKFGVWVNLGMVKCIVLFIISLCDLNLDLVSWIIVSRVYLLYYFT